MPLKVSVVDMIEIGAGGGSIARVEPASGLMKVGPRSAGAEARTGLLRPRRRSSRRSPMPTWCWAGSIPDYFLGGEMPLDLDARARGVRATAWRAS